MFRPDAGGLAVWYTEQGQGPLVLLCHGWPELGRSWRHQLGALAEAGFHAVAPDMRGYGKTTAPKNVSRAAPSTTSGMITGR